jgi:hypothetical protein
VKFERAVSVVGRLLRDDIQLQALYHMLVMMTPPTATAPREVRVRFKIFFHITYGTDKEENEIFLIYKEIQMGSVAKSYMTS